MRCKGRLAAHGISRETGRPTVTLEVEARILDRLEELKDRDLEIDLSIFRERRSLRANRFYWEILGKLSEKLRVSTTELHNRLLSRCGYIQYEMNYPVTVGLRTEVDPFKVEGQHLKPTSKITVDDNGELVCVCFLLRGSHTFNTAEMTRLIDELVAEAEAQGIDTLTEAEKQRMMAAYDKARSWEK